MSVQLCRSHVTLNRTKAGIHLLMLSRCGSMNASRWRHHVTCSTSRWHHYGTPGISTSRYRLSEAAQTRYSLCRHTRVSYGIPMAIWARCCSTSSDKKRQKLILLGTGWGSYSVLKTIDKQQYDVIVVSPRNHFLFTPMLCSTTVGTVEFRSIIEPVRNTGFRQANHFHLAMAKDLDLMNRKLTCESVLRPGLEYQLDYDKLVIGVGALSNTFGVPGVMEHALFLKEVSDARNIRNRLLSNIELAFQPGLDEMESQRLLHIVIVGGGPTGVEFGAELYDFVQQDICRLYKKGDEFVQVSLIESHNILGSFDTRLRTFAEKKMSARKRFHLIKAAVTEVTPTSVSLSDGTVLSCGLVVWSTGLSPRKFTQALSVPKNDRGQIMTDRYLRVLDTPLDTVYALGDCADIQDYGLPCTAQVAERQGRFLAGLLNKKSTKKFVFHSAGMLAYLGGYSGLADLPDFKLQGFPSWLLWRSAYLTRLGSWRLRMQVPVDWCKTLLFGRDTSRFD